MTSSRHQEGKKFRRGENISMDQKEHLLSFMETHSELGLGNNGFSENFTHENARQLWYSVTEELNSIPGAFKDWEKWKGTWQDLKNNALKKHKAYLRYERQKNMGNNTILTKSIVLNQSERRILVIANRNDYDGYNSLSEGDDSYTKPIPIQKPKRVENPSVVPMSSPAPVTSTVSISSPVKNSLAIETIDCLTQYERNSGICRACMNTCEEDPMLIFDRTRVSGIEVKINEIIEICIGLKITENDSNPHEICSKCVLKLKDFYKYRSQFHKCNAILTFKSKTEVEENVPTIEFVNFDAEEQKALSAITLPELNLPSSYNLEVESEIQLNDVTIEKVPENSVIQMELVAIEEDDYIDDDDFIVETIESDECLDIVQEDCETEIKNVKIVEQKPTEKKDKLLLKNYECNICDKKMYSSLKTLEMHMKLHDPGQCFTCEYCGKYFARRCQLKSHIMLHKGSKPYACRFCGHRSRLKTSNKVHERVHTGEKKYKCDQCDYVSITSSNLGKHKLSAKHATGTFECSICQKTSASSLALAEHMKHHDSDNRASCPICEKEFASRKRVMNHIRKVHKKTKKTVIKTN